VISEKNFKFYIELFWPRNAMDPKHFNKSGRGSCKEYPMQVSSNLAEWSLRRCHLKKLLTDEKSDDRKKEKNADIRQSQKLT
jgi:hypothetical protein